MLCLPRRTAARLSALSCIAALTIALVPQVASAQTWTSAATSNWTVGSNWDTNAPPASDPALAAFLEEVAGVGEDRLDSTRMALRLSAADREELERRLHALLDEYARRPVPPDGEKWSLYLGMHPEA